jgi:hypothetical protein
LTASRSSRRRRCSPRTRRRCRPCHRRLCTRQQNSQQPPPALATCARTRRLRRRLPYSCIAVLGAQQVLGEHLEAVGQFLGAGHRVEAEDLVTVGPDLEGVAGTGVPGEAFGRSGGFC